MRSAFIRDHRDAFPIEITCVVLQVSRGGYYAWIARPGGPAATRRELLIRLIREIHEGSRGTCGSPRIHRELLARGIPCSVNTMARLMRAAGIRCRAGRPFAPRTTDSRHDHAVAGNTLVREFSPERPGPATSRRSPRARAGCTWRW